MKERTLDQEIAYQALADETMSRLEQINTI